MTRLSVIVPGWNTKDSLWRRSIGSILSACGPSDEVICIDDGSAIKPLCLEELKCIDSRVKVVYLQKNGGQSHARNVGLSMANGEWITFVDSDDAVYGDAYKKCFEVIDKYTTLDVVVFGVRGIWLREKITRYDLPDDEYLGVLDAKKARRLYDARLFEYPCNKVYRRDFLEENKIKFNVAVCPGEDTIFNLTCALNDAKWCTIATVGYKYYRMDGTSLSRYLPNRADSYRIKTEMWKKFAEKTSDYEHLLSELVIFGRKNEVAITWDNMWRKGSPHKLIEKWRYLRKNRDCFKRAPIFELCFWAGRAFIRRYLYFSWVYKLHIGRLYNDFKKFYQEDDI